MESARTAQVRQSPRLTLIAGVVLLVGLVVFGWAAPGTYDIYLMLHVVAAVVWVGGGTTIIALALLAEREGEPRALESLGRKIEYMAQRVFVPSGLVVLLFGILMMIEGDLDWGQFWVIAGLVGFATTYAVGIGYLSPQVKKYNELVAGQGADHPLAQAQLRKVLLVARFDIALLLLIVAIMAAKPFS